MLLNLAEYNWLLLCLTVVSVTVHVNALYSTLILNQELISGLEKAYFLSLQICL